ncbi:MAG TPA: hypothetical protein VI455_05865 [Terriglobia bacterium]
MKSDVQRRVRPVKNGDFYEAFRKLSRSRRREVALDILRDQKVLADLYDHFLIQEALRESGRSIPWKTYRR